MELYRADLAAMIDHTALGPEVSRDRVVALCDEAKIHSFGAVCINPWLVPLANRCLKDSGIAIATVIGFPHGANATEIKAEEAERALSDGATELDMVLNVAALQAGDYRYVADEIRAVHEVRSKSPKDTRIKVILETALLGDADKRAACIVAKSAGADFVKTSTGFGPGGATSEDVALMREAIGEEMGIKAAGGIKTFDDARAMVEAGATRLGASAGADILEGAPT
ncbi:MAG: deoxyribose-phosphate aldolase [Candidatus Bipolaricaulia bacterium]